MNFYLWQNRIPLFVLVLKHMRELILTLLLAPAALFSAMAQTPSADEVLDKYLAAIGGKDFVKGITDLRIEMSADFNGNTALITRKAKAPSKSSMTINMNGMEVMKMTSDGTKAASGGMRGTQAMEGPAAQSYILQNSLFPEAHYAELGLKATVDGTEKVDGQDAYKVTFANADGSVSWTEFYDVASGLKVQTVSKGGMGGRGMGGRGGGQGGQGGGQGQGGAPGGGQGQGGGMGGGRQGGGPMLQTVKYSKYKDFKGLKYPTIQIQETPQGARETSIDKVRFNEGLKESDFKVE